MSFKSKDQILRLDFTNVNLYMKRNQDNSLFNRSINVLFFFILFFFFSSCSSSKYLTESNYQFKTVSGTPDYSSLNYWASHPWKIDAADNIPSSIQNKKQDSLVDVFFIHPTTYIDLKMSMGWNADIDNEVLNKKTDNSTILYQASVFNENCRIFAPRYRQANLKAFYTIDKNATDKAFDLAYEDVKNAFEYYLKYFNDGRPIIIASHSQGTLHAARLLKEFFENKKLEKQLVCAYIIGLPVFTNYFKELQPCKDSLQTGCFITWRTFKEGYVPEFVKKEKEIAYVTNPLTWTLNENLAPSNINKGGILRNFNKVIPGLVHAQAHGSVLWVNKPKFFGNIFLTAKNYHIADYNLFYMNIRENVNTRIRSFFKKN
jgi:hypothetical protein